MARDMNVGPAAERKLEQYGVWVKVEPRDVSPGRRAPPKLTDLGESAPDAGQKAADISEEEEHLLGELGDEMGQEAPAETLHAEAVVEAPEVPADLELEELPDDEQVEVPLAEGASRPGRFDDLEALAPSAEAPAAGAAAVPRGASSDILARIEAELRSIRADLTELKRELAGLHHAPAAPGPGQPPGGEEQPGGFFEEEEDDTIALTGDELDNILNTADITEEAAEAAPADTDLEAGLDAGLEVPEESTGGVLSDRPDILAYEEPSAASKAAPEAAAEVAEEIPAELVLEDLAEAAPAEQTEAIDVDLEGIPEIEGAESAELLETPEPATAAEPAAAEPEEFGELEEVAELEEIEEPVAGGAGKVPAEPEAVQDVDLESLANEQESGGEPVLSTEDISEADIAELEAVAEDDAPAKGPKGIEIDFEGAEPAAEAAPVAEPDAEPEARGPTGRSAEAPPAAHRGSVAAGIPDDLKDEIRKVLRYMDQLLEALPEDKIQEFASSDYFAMYRKLFEDLGLGS